MPSSFDDDIRELTLQISRLQPSDHVQFCANFFLERLQSQRAALLSSKPPPAPPSSSSSPSSLPSPSAPTAGMAHSTFPGTNPFAKDRNMQSIGEDEETHYQAPAAGGSDQPAFGVTGFVPGGAGEAGAGGQSYHFGRRTSVSAESMNPAEASSENWTPPVHAKSDEQKARLRQAFGHNFLFSHLDEEQTGQVLDALQEKPVPAKDIKVINQGEAGDFFYVVERGGFDIHVNASGSLEAGAEGMGRKVNSIGAGGSFGELALMYNAPRAATVVSTQPSTLWALDRVTFRRILMDSAFQRRQMYEAFLAEVPLLETLVDYERSKIADALNTQTFGPGETIIREGDAGENFYFVEAGEAEVFKQGQDKALRQYRKGDYFGELALLDNKPRAATVKSKTSCKVATLSKEGFQRLLGPVEDLMRRNDPSRKDAPGVDPLTKPS